jgi:hypothetical protein
MMVKFASEKIPAYDSPTTNYNDNDNSIEYLIQINSSNPTMHTQSSNQPMESRAIAIQKSLTK